MVTQLRRSENGRVAGGWTDESRRGVEGGTGRAARVIYDAMNKTRTKCIQGDATRATNTGVIFEKLKIFYDAMTRARAARA